MTPPDRPEFSENINVEREVDALCDRFEACWKRGERPDLDAWLPANDTVRGAALAALARLDLEYRLEEGEAVRVEDYFTRYPELRAEPRTALRSRPRREKRWVQ